MAIAAQEVQDTTHEEAGVPPDVGSASRREIGRGAIWAAASNIVMRVAGIAVTAVIARVLSPDEFGVYAVALAVFLVVTSLAELGMASAVARSPMEPSDIAGTVTSISMLVSFSVAGLMALLADQIAAVLGVPDAAEPIRVLSLSLALTGVFAVPGAQLVREFRQDRIFLAAIAGFVPSNVVLVVLALMGHGATAFAWSRVVGQLVTGTVFVLCLAHIYRPEWRREVIRSLLVFGLPLSLANLVNYALLNADFLLIGRFLDESDVGVYMIAFSVAGWSTAVLGSVLNGVVVPAFGRVSHDRERLRESIVSASRLVGMIALPICAVTIALSSELVWTVFGSTWMAAAPVLSVLAGYGAIFAFSLLFANVLVATGSTGRLLVIQMVWIAALLPAMVVGLEVGGLNGAAWAHVVVIGLVSMPAYVWAVRERTDLVLRELFEAIARPALAAAAAGLAAWLTAAAISGPVTSFLAGGSVSVAVYAVLVWPTFALAVPEVANRVTAGLSGLPRVGASRAATPLEPLRVAVVLEGLAVGGCPINALDLARVLRSRGHDVHVLAVDEQVAHSILPLARDAGLEVTLLPADAGLVRRALALRRYSIDHDLRVIHAFAPWLGPAAVLAAGVSGRRSALVLNWTMSNDRRVVRQAPLVVGTRELQREAQGHHPGAVWLLEPPVDLATDRPDRLARAEFRDRYAVADAELLLTLVGRVDREMKLPGLLLAIDAVEALDDPTLRLAIVGDGNAMGEVRERATAANGRLGREAVILTGLLRDPHPAYAAADVGLAMGGSALRVLAHRSPLVVLGEDGFARTFGPESEDYFVHAGYFGRGGASDPVGALVEQLRLLTDAGRRERLAEHGLAFVTSRFGLEVAATTLDGIYRETQRTSSGPLVRLWGCVALLGRHYAREGKYLLHRWRRRPEART